MPSRALGITLPLLAALLPAAPGGYEFWPGTSYDPRVPTHRQVLGYEPGQHITTHAGLLKYAEALAAASRQLKIIEYGTSWEGRKLFYLVVGSETNLRRLEEIRGLYQRLADPRRTPEAEARRLEEKRRRSQTKRERSAALEVDE